MKLQLFIQEVNNALEETSLQMVQNLPRSVSLSLKEGKGLISINVSCSQSAQRR